MDKDIKRKSTRNFNLEKKPAHKFDLEKEQAPEPDVNAEKPQIDLSDSAPSSENNNGSKKTLWIIIGIIIVAVIAYFGIRSYNHSRPEVTTTPVDTTDTTGSQKDSTKTDSTQNDTTVATGTTDNGATGTSPNSSGNQVGETTTSTEDDNKPVSTATPADIQNAAERVLDGEFGNGAERKQKLGSDYAAVQRYVNDLYKKGLAPRKP